MDSPTLATILGLSADELYALSYVRAGRGERLRDTILLSLKRKGLIVFVGSCWELTSKAREIMSAL